VTRSPNSARAVIAAILLSTGAAHAHGVGSSQLRLGLTSARAEGEWEVHLRDARLALGLDPDHTGDAAVEEVRARETALRSYVFQRLALAADGAPCPIHASAPLEWQPTLDQFRVRLGAICPAEPRRLALSFGVLFDLDPLHRAYFSVEDPRVTHVGVFRAGLRAVTLDIHQFHALAGFAEFAREGVAHIWTGLDHLLFLMALLLPAALVRQQRQWTPRPGLGATAREVVKVVTAFTFAHSITLALSFFGVVTLEARTVEVAIALSVFAAAWNNLRPFLPGRAWVMALGFGLVHGLGFAGALRNLSLPNHARGLALAGFNVGVELGQLAIVALALPLLYAASRRRFYPRMMMGVGSLLIAWVAVLWTLQRGLGLPLLARL
jgi:hypothetical protein